MRPPTEVFLSDEVKELHDAYMRLYTSFLTLPKYDGPNHRGSQSETSGKESRRLTLPDGTIINMEHTRANRQVSPPVGEQLFTNVTYYGPQATGVTQPKITTFTLAPNGLIELYLRPTTVQIEIGEATIPFPSGDLRIRRDSARFSDSSKKALKGATSPLVDWAVKVIQEKVYTEPPFTFSVK